MILNNTQENLLRLIKIGWKEKQINKILIYGRPGTGKTLFVNKISQVIKNKKIVKLSLSFILDFRFGRSINNIQNFFYENKNNVIFIDEIDSIASNRINNNDIREINRILNTIFQLMDEMNNRTMLVVATNVLEVIDPAFIRRFDLFECFDYYTSMDYKKQIIFFCKKYKVDFKNDYIHHLEEIIEHTFNLWTPSYLEQVIKICNLSQKINQSVSNQIRKTLKLIGLAQNVKELKNKLVDLGISNSTIEYITS